MQNSLTAASPASLAFVYEAEIDALYPEAIAAWKHHALSVYPEEACGFILKGIGFVAARNVHEEPRDYFRVAEVDVPDGDEIVGFLHTHTPGEPDPTGRVQPVALGPSKSDMQSQMDCGYPWGLSICDGETVTKPVWWGDTLQTRPLLGRQFVHGIWDCYSLVRDWHKLEHGLIIPDYPREHGWWDDKKGTGENMYEEMFASAGFKRVFRSSPLPGDCFICRLHANVLNHAGVYIGDDFILHHPGMTLSLRSPASRWHSKMDFLVRHKDLPEPDDA